MKTVPPCKVCGGILSHKDGCKFTGRRVEVQIDRPKRWVETRLVQPPGHSVMGRFGCSIMQVAYSRILDRWYWLQPGGIEERIAEPEELFLDEDYIANNLLKTPHGKREQPSRIHRGKRSEQLNFHL